MNEIELTIWIFLILVLIKYNEKPIYEYLLDIKREIYINNRTYNIDNWEELSE